MDDGWFGDKYKRNSDNSSLGDWKVDTRKLPAVFANWWTMPANIR